MAEKKVIIAFTDKRSKRTKRFINLLKMPGFIGLKRGQKIAFALQLNVSSIDDVKDLTVEREYYQLALKRVRESKKSHQVVKPRALIWRNGSQVVWPSWNGEDTFRYA